MVEENVKSGKWKCGRASLWWDEFFFKDRVGMSIRKKVLYIYVS